MEIYLIAFLCAGFFLITIAGVTYGTYRIVMDAQLKRIRRERARDRQMLTRFVHSSVEVFEKRLAQHSADAAASNKKMLEEYKQHFDFLCDDTVAKAETIAAKREEDYQAVAKAYFQLTGKDIVNPPKQTNKPMGLQEKRLQKERNIVAKERAGANPQTRQ